MATTHCSRTRRHILPFDNIETTVFIAELVQQFKSRNLDLDRLATYRCKQQGVFLQQKEATQHMAKEVAQIMQSWLPAPTAPDPSSQQRTLDLEAQLATLKGQPPSDASTPGSAPNGLHHRSDCSSSSRSTSSSVDVLTAIHADHEGLSPAMV